MSENNKKCENCVYFDPSSKACNSPLRISLYGPEYTVSNPFYFCCESWEDGDGNTYWSEYYDSDDECV